MIQSSPNRLTFVGLGLGADSAARRQIEHLAAVSGGRFVAADDPALLATIIKNVIQGGTGFVTPPPPTLPSGALLAVGAGVVNVALVVALVYTRLRRR